MGRDQEFLEAARNGNLSMFEKILNQKSKRGGPLASLRRGPGINVQDSVGYSALHYSALNGHTDIVRLLLFHDASPNLRDSRGSSALHLAAWAGHQEIVKMLLTHPYKPANPDMQTMENETPLHCAAQHGHTGALTTLLAHGADPSVRNSRNETPLDLAAQYGRLQAVQMLIRAHPELLQSYSVETSSHATHVSHSALHLASRNGHNNVVEILLAAGVNVNYRTPSGTALHEAALCGKDLVVRTLLEAGADLNATDSEGRTPLDVLQEFPPHVTRSIISVIQGFRRRSNVNLNERRSLNEVDRSSSASNAFEQNNSETTLQENHPKQNNFVHISPSVSTHSFEHESISSHVPALNDEFYVKMEPVKMQKAAPKKPPRRNLSISPTHLQNFILNNEPFRKSIEFCDSSVAENYIPSTSENPKKQASSSYEYICSASSGSATYSSNENIIDTTPSKTDSWYTEMAESACFKPVPAPRKKNSQPPNENANYKSYNPNRKLRRNREHYFTKGQFTLALSSSNQNISAGQSNSTPGRDEKRSPKRPLSQEYKYPPDNLLLCEDIGICQQDKHSTSLSLCNSSGSISSGVSLSDRSLSTDCVEEYVCDEPFAGLFKGSTVNLNGGSSKTPTGYISNDHIKIPALRSKNFVREKNTKTTTTAADSQSESSDEVSNINEKAVKKNLKKDKRLSSESKSKPMEAHSRKAKMFSSHVHMSDNNQTTSNLKSNDNLSLSASSSVAVENKPVAYYRNSKILSSFNEQETWKKLSQIMETFGNSTMNGLSSYTDSDEIIRSEDHVKLAILLEQNGLRYLERTLYMNGYDNFKFMNGIFDETDLAVMNISGDDAQNLIKFVKTLPFANFTPVAIESSLDHWLSTIQLTEYNDNFKKHLYNTLKSVCGVWEIELQTVLEINKIGHRKRILLSVSKIRQAAEQTTQCETASVDKFPRGTLRSNKKTRPAPKPPIKSLEIRAPSELLIGLPSKLHMKWPHSASTLVSNSLKYEVCYLGSTVVKELRGTESTRKSIQKLKRVGQSSSLQNSTNDPQEALVQLSISHRGVEFIDIKSNKGTVCEHEIRNINCACQDADDMRFFAYITKDNELNLHYCHVFNVDNMHLAMEIILTLAQSFEVAYQMALRNTPPMSRKIERC